MTKYKKPVRKPKTPETKSEAITTPAVKIAASGAKRRVASTNPTPSSKTAQCLALLKRRDGVSIVELQTATGWQSHSVRGFLTATIKKKLGLSLTSTIARSGERRYRVSV